MPRSSLRPVSSRPWRLAVAGTVIVPVLFLGCSDYGTVVPPPPPPTPIDCTSVADSNISPTLSYANDIAPLWAQYSCLNGGCHGGPLPSSNFSLDNYQNIFKPGEQATRRPMCSVRPGDPDASYIVWKLEGRSEIEGKRMPRDLPSMAQSDIAKLKLWIFEGARDN